ncbi:MAG: pentapeptide repeat-containing protein [Methylocystis sp.]
MASEELRKFRLQRAKDFAERHRSNSSAKISPDELAAIKKKADDLDAIQKSVSDAAAVGAPLWLSYIFLLFYIAIAAGAVTHKELLLESPVDLPFLNIKLPLKAFFILAPILFLIVHAYVLAHFAMLSDKAKAFHDRLTAKITAKVENDHAIREGLRQQLPINVFVQFLAGPTDIRESAFGVMLWVIAWTTLVGAPVAVLLLLQLQFLPYHDTRVTWLHRVILCIDLAVIWWLWMKILDGRDRSKPKHLDRWMKGWDDFLWFFRRFGAQLATVSVALFSVLIATFPGEWEDWPFRLPQKLEHRIGSVTEFVFGKVDARNDDESKRVTGNWPVNTLRLREFDIYAALGVEGPKKIEWKPYSFSLKDRRLERADLREARLGNVDLRGARLNGALLDEAKLEKASLDAAKLPEASLVGAQLQGVSFEGAQLQGTSLNWASAQIALFSGAEAQGASFFRAEVQAASFTGAQLQSAFFNEANVQGASLEGADLQVASLEMANLEAVSFNGVNLQGASFDGAQLQGVDFDGAKVKGVLFENAYLWRTFNSMLDVEEIKSIRLKKAKWEPLHGTGEAWSNQAYGKLREMIAALPKGELRDAALERVARLDCRLTDDNYTSCNRNTKIPSKAKEWRKFLESAQVEDAAYAKNLADHIRKLICGKDANAIYILRSISGGIRDPWAHSFTENLQGSRLNTLSRVAPALIDDILQGNNCPVSSALTDADKTRLQMIKAAALTNFPPAPSPAAVQDAPSVTASPSAPPVKAPAKGKSPSSPRVAPPP